MRLIGLTILLLFPTVSSAQSGFNPEFMGNGAPGPFGGFCMKYFMSYFHQEGINAHDPEIALEAEYFSPGFSGSLEKDQFLYLVHAPIGYRSESENGETSRGGGIGSISANVQHFYQLHKSDSSEVWFDNGISVGFPTATKNDGVRIGGNSYSLTWYQENFVKKGRWIASFIPVAVSWGFRDSHNDEKSGLSLSFANSSIGHKISSKVFLGVNFGLSLGRVVGSSDGEGESMPQSLRLYAGPSGAIEIQKNLFLQIGSAIDLANHETDRGQGVFLALWNHIL